MIFHLQAVVSKAKRKDFYIELLIEIRNGYSMIILRTKSTMSQSQSTVEPCIMRKEAGIIYTPNIFTLFSHFHFLLNAFKSLSLCFLLLQIVGRIYCMLNIKYIK